MQTAQRPQLVLFDCDGVIVDSEHITVRSLQANLRGFGLDLGIDQVASLCVGGTMSVVADNLRSDGTALPDDWLETFYSEVYDDVLGREVTVITGFSGVLDRLDRAELRYVVCFNGRLRKIEIMLTRIGEWERLQGCLYSAQELGSPKPAPDVYLKAAADRGVASADCVVVEDSMIGARAARAAGMRCLGYAGRQCLRTGASRGADLRQHGPIAGTARRVTGPGPTPSTSQRADPRRSGARRDEDASRVDVAT